MPIKVLHVMGMDSLKYGGIERFMITLQNATPDIEHILVYDSLPKSEDYLRHLHSRILEMPIQGIHTFISIPRFISILRQEHPDYVHFHFESAFAIYSYIAHFMGIKVIYKTAHSCLYVNGKQAVDIKDLSCKYQIVTLGKYAYRYINKTLAVSNFVRDQLIGVYGKHIKVETMYLGSSPCSQTVVNTRITRSSINIKDSDIVVGTTLFASHIKGCDILYRAIALVKKSNIKFLVLGLNPKSEFTNYLNNLAIELGIANRIISMGIIDNVPEYLRLMDIFVQPSRTEALSLSCVEAASAGLPIIGSNVGGLPEVSSITFPVEDHVRLAELIDELASNEEYRLLLGSQSFKRFSDFFSIGNTINKYKTLYQCR